MDKTLKAFVNVIVVLLATLLAAFIEGLFVMWLWNWLMPVIFGLGAITYWQGWGISFLCGLLFKGTTTVKTKD